MAQYLTHGDLRRHYGSAIGRDRLYRLIHAGHLKAFKLNGKTVVTADEVARFDRILQAPNVRLLDTDGTVLIERCNP